jgi:citrate synthase
MTQRTIEAGKDRRGQPRVQSDRWQTALTAIAPNKILIRGYPLDEMMGRLSFAEAVYLLLMGELPTPAIGRMFNAILVSSIDHGVAPPSTLAARNVATSGAPMKDSVAAGVLAFGPHHGGDIESCMRFLDAGLALVRGGRSPEEAAGVMIDDCSRAKQEPPGFGHRGCFRWRWSWSSKGSTSGCSGPSSGRWRSDRSSSSGRCRSTWTARLPPSAPISASRTSWGTPCSSSRGCPD